MEYVRVTTDIKDQYLNTKDVKVGHLLEPIINQAHLMSTNALIAAVQKSAKLLEEFGLVPRHVVETKELLVRLRKTRDEYGTSLYLSEHPNFRDRIIRMVCEWVLRANGMGSLHGFHYVATSSVEGGVSVDAVLPINPETQSTLGR